MYHEDNMVNTEASESERRESLSNASLIQTLHGADEVSGFY